MSKCILAGSFSELLHACMETGPADNADGQAVSSTDALGGVTTTVEDANGNVIQTTTPDGLVTETVGGGKRGGKGDIAILGRSLSRVDRLRKLGWFSLVLAKHCFTHSLGI